MTNETDLSDLGMSVDDAIGVWHDLEQALAGKNGFGGDVAEIYAYRLVPRHDTLEEAEALAPIAGKSLTRLLRHFAERHEGVVFAIEDGRDSFRILDLSVEEFPPFSHRVHLRVTRAEAPREALSTHDLRASIAEVQRRAGDLVAMLDELAVLRAKERLRADARPPAPTDDLPPDAATGLYLDRPFAAEDLVWIKTALGSRDANSGVPRYGQLMLVFAAIQRDDRCSREFFRVMNTIVLPLLRRTRLKEHPHLASLGAAGE